MLKAKHIITAISLALCLISLSVIVTLNFRPLYLWEMEWTNLAEKTGFSEETILSNYDALIEYNSAFYQGDLKFPSLPMSEEGRIHFVEVKEIFVFIQVILFPGTLIVAAIGSWLLRKTKPLYLKWSAYFMIGIPAILGILIGLYWDKVFVIFHKIFFQNDYWIFDYRTDPIIRFLPDSYFMHCAIMILGLVIFSSIVCLLVYHGVCSRKKKAETKEN